MGIQDHLTCLQREVKKQHFELDMEQWISSKLGKEYIQAEYCHPVYLTYVQSTSCEMPGRMNQAGINISGRNISNLRCAEDTTLLVESEEQLKNS